MACSRCRLGISVGSPSVRTWKIEADKADFDRPRGAILGILSAILSLGSISATPFISIVGDRHGRRRGIQLGCLIMLTGGVLQGASVHSKCLTISLLGLC